MVRILLICIHAQGKRKLNKMSLPGVVYLPDLEITSDNPEQGIRQLVKVLRPNWTEDDLEINVSIMYIIGSSIINTQHNVIFKICPTCQFEAIIIRNAKNFTF